MRGWKIALTTIVLLAAGTATAIYFRGYDLGMGAFSAPAQAPAQHAFVMPVPVTPVVKKTVPIDLEYSARTESIRNIPLQARVTGYIAAQLAPDGAEVKEGDLLYRIDPRDLQAALDQATAQQQRDTAALEYARANFNRGDELVKSGFVAKDALEQRESALRQAQAAVTMDQALIRTAQLNLGYAEIRAPFSGRIGRNQAPIGTLVSVAGTTLNTLVQLDPIYVTFNPSEAELPDIQKAYAAGKVEVAVLVPAESEAHHKGKLTFIDNIVDRATGTITARATIANGDFALLPGQYVHARLHLKDEPDALLVPQTALGSSQLGKYVYVVGADNKAEQRLVTLGPTAGDLVVVTKGVSEGDRIITGNLQKIGPGAPVQPLPAKAQSGT
ncbi:MAG: efflux RND transporter periplasmic adaptor subunit [Hyphomicrobiales bacterium]|nr:efflux RND transporter periplasmic adaptor subunit [Hyphomicrobiales bacterium]